MKSLLSLFVTILFFYQSQAQSVLWAKHGKAPKTERGNDITFDLDGNVYITGDFQDSVTFDTKVLKNSFGNYCAKYDSSGNVKWAYDNLGGSGIVFDGSNSLYLFNNSNATLQRLDLNGGLVWSKLLFTNSIFSTNGIQDVFVKGSDVYVIGYYSGNAFFSPTDTLFNKTPASGWDIFIAKYTSAGAFQWARTAGGNGLDKGYGIYVNSSDDVYTTGYFKDTAIFGATVLISNGAQDIFLSKYSSSGGIQWAKNYGGSGFDLAAKITGDEKNEYYITGRYANTMVLGSKTLNAVQTDAFVAKFNSNGLPLWATGISGSGNDEEADIFYEKGKLAFMSTTNGNTTIGDKSLTGLGGLDMCIGKMDTNGTVIWAKIFGGNSDDEASGICLINGSTYFTGSFKSTANFGNIPLSSAGIWDIVTGKIDNTFTPSSSLYTSVDQSILLYPNPTSDALNIDNSSNHFISVDIFNSIGQFIHSYTLNSSLNSIRLSELKSGIYYLKMQGELSQKVIQIIKN